MMKLLHLLFSLTFSYLAFSQPSLLNLKEIPLDNSLSFYQFFHEKGNTYSLLAREQVDSGHESILKYYKINSQLEITKESYLYVNESVDIELATENTTHIYVLLKDVSDKYSITALNKDTGSFTSTNITFQQSVELEQMLATEDALFLGGYIEGKAVGYKSLFDSIEPQVLYYQVNENIRLKRLQFHSEVGIVSFLLETGNELESRAYYINQFKANGELLYNLKVPTPLHYRITDAKLLVKDNKSSILIGTYSLAVNAGDNITGLFSINLKEREIANTHFYNLGKLKNFFAYLPEKAADKKINRLEKASSNVRPIKTDIYIELEDLEIASNRILLQGNSFRSIKNYNKSHDYEYLNTFLAGFDFKGRLLWNNTLTYPNEKLISSSPVSLTAASLLNKNIFFIQKQQYIYRSKLSEAGVYNEQINETYINDGFFSKDFKNYFYFQKLHLTDYGNLLYFGLKEVIPMADLMNSKLVFFVELIEANPAKLISKGAN